MRKSFSVLLLFILISCPLCAEFTLPFPENSRIKNGPGRVLREKSAEPIRSQNRAIEKEKPITSKIMDKDATIEASLTSSEPKVLRKPRVLRRNGENSIHPPKFYRGIYIHNSLISNKSNRKKLENVLSEAAEAGVNVLVIDLQSATPPAEEIRRIKELGFYPIGRLVNFDGGLKTEFPTQARLNSILSYVGKACAAGFPEIQLDYIRYADDPEIKVSIKKKYQNIGSIIGKIRSEANKCDDLPYLGADIFGRIPFNKDDLIGQKVEVFSQLVDVLYPMLYPSHFYGQPERISNPYKTIYDGLTNAKKRALPETRVVGYIQGFTMKIAHSKKTLKDYVKAQIEASVDSKSDGFVVWNAWSDYRETFKAIRESVKDGKLDISE
ncbi:glycoside hydrolase domain protein [Leptospira broomii serovar Hurstbridge str. 5399]|uniref:Glycoside hydrolase domain protein n=1 Tax=Leptospira broomii serovar Hurstbridge str. 5399 TaxID=1049789 RepID=T0GCT3_9LEPT|nr:glycoside hydrolase domain protein [Leptospira broomii serovar Hurstbridge str. 5399]